MNPERWLPVVEAVGYEVSDQGRVRSRLSGSTRVLRQRVDRHGYRTVQIRTTSGRLTRYVHRLVATAFVSEPLPGQVTRHLNGDQSDNRAVNLAFGTQSQNVRDAVAHGTHVWARRTRCPRDHEYEPRGADGKRRCSTCRRKQRRERYLRERAA